METQNNFILNDAFKKNAKVYQTKPVLATKYMPGMETGWVVYICNQTTKEFRASQHEAMVFFDTEQEAWNYIHANNPQYAEVDGVLVEVPVIYDAPVPVLHRRETNPDNKVGLQFCFEGKYALKSNETEMFDFFILDCDHTTPDTWIIQDANGKIRVWDKDFLDCGETFFGYMDRENLVCEKIGENTYKEVAV